MTLRTTIGTDDDEHGTLHWSFCKRSYCEIHGDAQSAAHYFPGTRRQEDDYEPCAQRPEESQTLRQDGYRTTPVDHLYEEYEAANRANETGDSRENEEDRSDEEPNEIKTYYMESTVEMRDLLIEVVKYDEELFPADDEETLISENTLNYILGSIRRRYWNYTRAYNEEEKLANFVQEMPPLGSVFDKKGGYITPRGYHVNSALREGVRHTKAYYQQSQEIQDQTKPAMWMSQQVQEEARRHREALEKFTSGPKPRSQTENQENDLEDTDSETEAGLPSTSGMERDALESGNGSPPRQ
nr:hypothetical protein CFP56_79572 [Quercus suber]